MTFVKMKLCFREKYYQESVTNNVKNSIKEHRREGKVKNNTDNQYKRINND